MKKTTREEHLEWCKKRAMEYIDRNDLHNAFTSIVSDMSIHDETENHPDIFVGMKLLINGLLDNKEQMKNFIEGIK